MSREKIFNLKAMGAEVVLTRSDVAKGHPAVLPGSGRTHRRARHRAPISSTSSATRQPAAAHETDTGPEILEQMDGRVDAIVFGCGSSGTMTGLSRYFAEHSPDTAFILADPVGSILAQYINRRRAVRQVGELDGGGHRRGFPAADQRLQPRDQGLCDQPTRKVS
jgi:cystathionine beta-synthase